MCEIIKCSMKELPAVVALSKLWAEEGITYGLAANTYDDLKDRLDRYFWIARQQSEIIGYVYGTIHTSEGLAVIPAGERYLEIDEIYVHPDHRSGGLGHRLVDCLLAEAESEGITRSVVYSAMKQWQRIVGFYEKHGFQMWFVQMYR